MGRLIIIEGGDGSGKATQTALLKERLLKEGYKVKSVSFPNYDSPAAMPVKMYLAGDFGKKPSDVNPFVASSLYAVDRFASFRMDWQNFYEEGGIILADRYTTSNMVHQMVKYEDPAERKAFLDWLEDFEFVKFGLPRPDAVLFTGYAPCSERSTYGGAQTIKPVALPAIFMRKTMRIWAVFTEPMMNWWHVIIGSVLPVPMSI